MAKPKQLQNLPPRRRRSREELLSAKAWREACRRAASAGLKAVIAAKILEDPSHPACFQAWKFLAEQGYGKARQGLDVIAVNPASLTDEQLQRLAAGELPMDVLSGVIDAEFTAEGAADGEMIAADV